MSLGESKGHRFSLQLRPLHRLSFDLVVALGDSASRTTLSHTVTTKFLGLQNVFVNMTNGQLHGPVNVTRLRGFLHRTPISEQCSRQACPPGGHVVDEAAFSDCRNRNNDCRSNCDSGCGSDCNCDCHGDCRSDCNSTHPCPQPGLFLHCRRQRRDWRTRLWSLRSTE